MSISNTIKNYFSNEKKMILNNQTIADDIVIDLNNAPKRLVFDKSSIGSTDDEKLKHNVFAIARKNKYVKNLVVELANNGYYLVEHKDGISTFEKFDTAEKFKHNLTNSNLNIYKDLFYTLDKPSIASTTPRLLVVFSSVADFSLNASISRRNFFINFKSINKYVPSNTYVLRISDIGAVVGSFYLNNNFNKNVEKNVQELLKLIMKGNGIEKKDVVLYGASKGATASLYHALKGGYNSVCVDPIVSDEYHENQYNDPHFTQGTFPLSKQEKFIQLMKEVKIISDVNIIYSINSPIYEYINAIIKDHDMEQKIKYINISHPKIKDHPDVGPNTIDVLTLIINNLFYKLGDVSSKNLTIEAKIE